MIIPYWTTAEILSNCNNELLELQINLFAPGLILEIRITQLAAGLRDGFVN